MPKTIKKHYETIPKINTSNYFFKALFQEKKDNFFRNCYRSDKFLTSEKEENEHNFLDH